MAENTEMTDERKAMVNIEPETVRAAHRFAADKLPGIRSLTAIIRYLLETHPSLEKYTEETDGD